MFIQSLCFFLAGYQLYHEDQHAGGHGHVEKAEAAPCKGHSRNKGGKAGPLGVGGLHHGGEGHGGKGHVGHIVEEGTQGDVLYLAAYERERQDADEVGHNGHDGNVDISLFDPLINFVTQYTIKNSEIYLS